MKALPATVALFVVLTLAAAACGGSAKTVAATAQRAAPASRACAFPAGWRKLATQIAADVYCPAWLPGPLTSQIGGTWNNIYSVGKDRSYLVGFVWQEMGGVNGGGGELHVNLRGYPESGKIPTCLEGLKDTTPTPCFAEPHGHVSANGIRATLYTVNQDADSWHLLLAWHHKGGLYTVSEHLAPPLDYRKVVVYLKKELGSLVLVAPARQT